MLGLSVDLQLARWQLRQTMMAKKVIRVLLAFIVFLALSAWVGKMILFEDGLYGWLIRMEAKLLGSYFPGITMGVLWTVVAVIPATLILGKRGRPMTHEELVRAKRVGVVSNMLIAVLLILMAGGAFLLSKNEPDKNEGAMELNVSGEQRGNLILRKVKIVGGTLGFEQSTSIIKTSSKSYNKDKETFYIPVLAEGNEAGDQPVKYIYTITNSGNGSMDFKANAMSGIARPGVVPALARDGFEEAGIKLADSTTIISYDGLARKECLYVATVILGLFGFFMFVAAIAKMFRKVPAPIEPVAESA